VTIGRQVARILPPPIKWRARNLLGLARWIRLSATLGSAPADGYAAAFWEFHQGGDWAGLADLVVRYCAPRSLVDIGCGDAKLLAALRARDAGLDLLGIDSSAAALAQARRLGVRVEQRSPAFWRRRHSQELAARIAGFDVSVSLETAEHLPPWSGPALVRVLTRGRLAVFSAAAPGQGGTLHMNERPFGYWHRQFAAQGFQLSGCDPAFRAAVKELDLPWWYAANIHVFDRSA